MDNENELTWKAYFDEWEMGVDYSALDIKGMMDNFLRINAAQISPALLDDVSVEFDSDHGKKPPVLRMSVYDWGQGKYLYQREIDVVDRLISNLDHALDVEIHDDEHLASQKFIDCIQTYFDGVMQQLRDYQKKVRKECQG
jgi:hypothetical protein